MKKETKLDIKFWWVIIYNLFLLFYGSYEIFSFNGLNFMLKVIIFLMWIRTIKIYLEEEAQIVIDEIKKMYDDQIQEIRNRRRNNID